MRLLQAASEQQDASPGIERSGQNRWGDSWPPMGRISGRPRGIPVAAYGENLMATHSCLAHPVLDSRDTQRPSLGATRLRDIHPPRRPGAITLFPELVLELVEERLGPSVVAKHG